MLVCLRVIKSSTEKKQNRKKDFPPKSLQQALLYSVKTKFLKNCVD